MRHYAPPCLCNQTVFAVEVVRPAISVWSGLVGKAQAFDEIYQIESVLFGISFINIEDNMHSLMRSWATSQRIETCNKLNIHNRFTKVYNASKAIGRTISCPYDCTRVSYSIFFLDKCYSSSISESTKSIHLLLYMNSVPPPIYICMASSINAYLAIGSYWEKDHRLL